MNHVWVRLALYTLATGAAAMGFGHFDAEAGTLTLNLNEIAMAVAGAGIFNAAVFAKWGVK
jgi:hypothetical protein